MNAATPRSQVRVAPGGVRTWLAQDRRSAERDLLEHLLARPGATAPDLRALAQDTGRPVAELARALFSLNRRECIWVGNEPSRADADGASGLAELSAELQALVHGRDKVVIADCDGLCLAAYGWQGREADRAATIAATRSFPTDVGARWWFAAGEVTLAATAAIDPASAAWVRIARRLLHACGPLAAGASA